MEGPRSTDENDYPLAHAGVLRAIRVRAPARPYLSVTLTQTVAVKHSWTLLKQRAFL